MSDHRDPETNRQMQIQSHIDALKLYGVPEFFLDLWIIWKAENAVGSASKAGAIEDAIWHVTRELATHGIV